MGAGCPPQVCRWVARRLPLLSGGELTGAERRKVERHLLACASCRHRQTALDDTLGILRRAAAEEPAAAVASAAAASLWPALQRQIREEKHAPRGWWSGLHDQVDTWLDDLSAWFRFGFGLPVRLPLALGAALGLTLLTAAGVEGWARWRFTALARVAAPPHPIPLPPTGPAPSDERIGGPASLLADNAPAPPTASPGLPAPLDLPLQGDLDHGTPMGPDAPRRETAY